MFGVYGFPPEKAKKIEKTLTLESPLQTLNADNGAWDVDYLAAANRLS